MHANASAGPCGPEDAQGAAVPRGTACSTQRRMQSDIWPIKELQKPPASSSKARRAHFMHLLHSSPTTGWLPSAAMYIWLQAMSECEGAHGWSCMHQEAHLFMELISLLHMQHVHCQDFIVAAQNTSRGWAPFTTAWRRSGGTDQSEGGRVCTVSERASLQLFQTTPH